MHDRRHHQSIKWARRARVIPRGCVEKGGASVLSAGAVPRGACLMCDALKRSEEAERVSIACVPCAVPSCVACASASVGSRPAPCFACRGRTHIHPCFGQSRTRVYVWCFCEHACRYQAAVSAAVAAFRTAGACTPHPARAGIHLTRMHAGLVRVCESAGRQVLSTAATIHSAGLWSERPHLWPGPS